MPDYISGTLLDLRSSILPSILDESVPTTTRSCRLSECESTGYVCPLCAVKGLVRLCLFCEETAWLCYTGAVYQRSSYGGPSSLPARLEAIPEMWEGVQSSLVAVLDAGLLYSGQANSLLEGKVYSSLFGLPSGWSARTESAAEDGSAS